MTSGAEQPGIPVPQSHRRPSLEKQAHERDTRPIESVNTYALDGDLAPDEKTDTPPALLDPSVRRRR